MTTRSELFNIQRDAEMRRGREVAEANALVEFRNRYGCEKNVKERRDVLTRWEEAGKVSIGWDDARDGKSRLNRRIVLIMPPDQRSRQGNTVHFDAAASDEWPTEALLANVGLAIGALSSFDGVKELTKEQEAAEIRRARRDEQRSRVTPTSFWDDK